MMTSFSLSLQMDRGGRIKPYVRNQEWCILTSFLYGFWVGTNVALRGYALWMGEGRGAEKFLNNWTPTEVAH